MRPGGGWRWPRDGCSGPDTGARQLGVAHSGGVERQQQNAMVGSERRIDSASQRFNPQGLLEACRNRFDQLDSDQGVGT